MYVTVIVASSPPSNIPGPFRSFSHTLPKIRTNRRIDTSHQKHRPLHYPYSKKYIKFNSSTWFIRIWNNEWHILGEKQDRTNSVAEPVLSGSNCTSASLEASVQQPPVHEPLRRRFAISIAARLSDRTPCPRIQALVQKCTATERTIACLYKKWHYDRLLPVILSHKMRDVIIRPYGLNRDSKSCWVMFFGNPETYRLAPLIASELGRAYDTWKQTTSWNDQSLPTTLLFDYSEHLTGDIC